MGFSKVPCPGLYLHHKQTNPKLFVGYVQEFIKTNDRGMKAVGVETHPDGQVFILSMPDYDAKRPIVTFSQVKGKKTKKIEYEKMWKQPVECYLDDADFAYLEKKGMDRHGNKKESGQNPGR